MYFAPIIRRALPRRRHLGVLLTGVLAVTGTPTPAAAAVTLVSATPARAAGFDGLVYASAYVGSTVYVGGSFRNAIVNGRLVPRKRLAALDARTGALLPWAPAVDSTVWALAAAGSSVYITGRFTKVGGQPRAGLASVNRTTGAVGPLRHTVTGAGLALAAGAGRLYLGGTVSAVDGRPVHNLAAFRLTDGAVDRGFHGGADAKVRVLKVAGSRLYVGGDFKRLNGVAGTARLAALRPADGQIDAGFRSATPYGVFAVTVTPDRVYAALGGPGGRVASYQNNGGLIWNTVLDGDVQAISYLRGTVYAGGHFTVGCPEPSRTAISWCPSTLRPQPRMAAFNATTGSLLTWNPHSNGKWGVLTMDANATLGTVAAGGEFTSFGDHDRPHFAQFNTSCVYGCGARSRVRP